MCAYNLHIYPSRRELSFPQHKSDDQMHYVLSHRCKSSFLSQILRFSCKRARFMHLCLCMRICRFINKCEIKQGKCASVIEMHKCVWVMIQVCDERVCMQVCVSLWKPKCEYLRVFARVFTCCVMLVVSLCYIMCTKCQRCENKISHCITSTLVLVFELCLINFAFTFRKLALSLFICMSKWVCASSTCKTINLVGKLMRSAISLLTLIPFKKMSMGGLWVIFECSSSTLITYLEQFHAPHILVASWHSTYFDGIVLHFPP